MPKPESLGRVELTVLRLVAEHQSLSVREAADKLSSDQDAADSGPARTTVLTVLERLRKKGYLSRRKVEGVNRYTPRVAMTQLVQSLIGDFVSGVLGGSVSPFVAYLGKQTEVQPEELAELKRLVRELDCRDQQNRDSLSRDKRGRGER